MRRSLEMRPDNYADFEFTAEAEKVHGWSKERIIALPPESGQYRTLIADLARFGGERLTVTGYNVDFDIQFLKDLFYRNKSPGSQYGDYFKYLDAMPFDVLQFAQGFRVAGLLDLPNLQLETVCAHFGIDTSGAHSALADILNTKAVFDKLLALRKGEKV